MTVAADPDALPVNAPVNVVALTLPALILPVLLLQSAIQMRLQKHT